MRTKYSTGERLKILRGSRSLQEVADAVGVSRQAISMYEQDQRTPRDYIKRKIADFYKVSVASIFFAE